ncbi:hypothetical protein L8Z47_001678 [Salmonella enterica]|uniref:Uncharacterized protein n=1 Tax=Salmonella enterica TaxID=28901 RepID=A0A757UG36_SALER|nr:hypothetical protein [Salmonella enterica]EDQ6228119.1 hypothetical protein [Salmonella enterica subsp. enterica serovar Tucson]EDV5491853.1 hypothetical protein [Salmonella enterica subsp. enterica]EGI5655305.1 hypothetical protein [Salmonella enterica subsp. enterica serovar Kisarawe]EDO5355631.1 hypothetical protein [Salmonella enterica subsp. enterica serovar Rubislaw]EDQ4965867.1 hypothetical protein [Salmonella enterica]
MSILITLIPEPDATRYGEYNIAAGLASPPQCSAYRNADYDKETMDAVTINISQTKCCH